VTVYITDSIVQAPPSPLVPEMLLAGVCGVLIEETHRKTNLCSDHGDETSSETGHTTESLTAYLSGVASVLLHPPLL
jgi:hypothetical protein